MEVVVEIFLLVFWSGIFAMIADLKTSADHLANLVLSRTYTCHEITTLGSLVALVLSNM
uniref:Uncharacterized protein n=1 Tax=Vitis vinifera TaxID=29760 RepID=F6HPR7_VITVI